MASTQCSAAQVRHFELALGHHELGGLQQLETSAEGFEAEGVHAIAVADGVGRAGTTSAMASSTGEVPGASGVVFTTEGFAALLGVALQGYAAGLRWTAGGGACAVVAGAALALGGRQARDAG
jgi:hypothetical protein